MNITTTEFLKHYNSFCGEENDNLSQIKKHTFDGFELMAFVLDVVKNITSEKELNLNEVTETQRLYLQEIASIYDQRKKVFENAKQNFTPENIKTLMEYYTKRIELLQNILKKLK